MGSSFSIRTEVQMAARGDSASFARLYEHLIDRVYPFVVSRTKRPEHALDVTQDSFIALHGSLKNFRYQSDQAFYGYVFTIVRRQLAVYYERERTRAVEPFDESLYSGDDPSLVETLDVAAALETLDAETKDIMVLHHWSRFTFGEIASMLGLAESAVRVLHHRAKKVLQEYFDTKPPYESRA